MTEHVDPLLAAEGCKAIAKEMDNVLETAESCSAIAAEMEDIIRDCGRKRAATLLRKARTGAEGPYDTQMWILDVRETAAKQLLQLANARLLKLER